jgi:hypothetical protein
MRKSMRKLSLNRETIGRLDPLRMEQAAGGNTLTCMKPTTCCDPPTDPKLCGSMTHCEGSVCCTQVYAGCNSGLSQCATVCIPCQTGTACVG